MQIRLDLGLKLTLVSFFVFAFWKFYCDFLNLRGIILFRWLNLMVFSIQLLTLKIFRFIKLYNLNVFFLQYAFSLKLIIGILCLRLVNLHYILHSLNKLLSFVY